MIELAVGLGVILSMVFYEVIGVSAGGIVVPGYVALQMHAPERLLGTIIASLLTYLVLRIISRFMFLYGRRRLVMAILLGFVFGYLTRQTYFWSAIPLGFEMHMQAVGFIIPGLIANWMERQGIWKTVLALVLTASTVRLLLIVLMGGQVLTNV
ncbi:MAG: poly-gamma-glutamate biosynthesis protein PgsC [Candidatus Delongbacteria bacterium]|nr:poly-gamma-glutamate biosynthesis protein PgsC [bacterium]MBL7033988.1 poly-gamma-glutamate biosynthesis protein PgsC [Candidatus Delongbacteria bacterium]